MRPGSLSPSIDPTRHVALRIVFSFAAVSFVAASLLANWLVRAFYVISAVWVGLMTFCLFAAASCWITLGSVRVMGLHVAVNSARVRVTRITIKLQNLPDSWRGRVAALPKLTGAPGRGALPYAWEQNPKLCCLPSSQLDPSIS